MINLEAKEYLLDAVLEYSKDIVTVKDKNLRYIAYNNAFREIIGVSRDFKILGKSISSIIESECADIINENSKKVLSTCEIKTCIFVLKKTNDK